jgi:hypothetical protein
MFIANWGDHKDLIGADPLLQITIYHPSLGDTTKRVDVTCIGTNCVDSQVESSYDEVSDMPVWVQEHIAVLSIAGEKVHIPYVGVRVNEDTYLIVETLTGEDDEQENVT